MNLDAVFAALADPTRREILARLTQGEACIAELAEPFDITPRAVSKHVAVLEAAGLVARGKDAQRRPARIRVEPFVEVDRWLNDYRRLWNDRFNRLSQRLTEQQKQQKGGET
jgi:DNA-binding transcriptional ArsR family regulator